MLQRYVLDDANKVVKSDHQALNNRKKKQQEQIQEARIISDLYIYIYIYIYYILYILYIIYIIIYIICIIYSEDSISVILIC